MPSFNWARLRPIAHSIASTIRHAQASAYQLHRDLETIREENRRYAAAHYGTAPHWDGYGPDGRLTGNGNGNGNRSSRNGSRSGNRNGNSDRQRQRDRSFERAHPWMSRMLYYSMPHLGGYETGRGFTWNAQGERWGDSFRRGAEYLSNIRRLTAEARAYRSSATVGWGTPSGGMPLPNPSSPTPSPAPIPNQGGGTAGGEWGQWGTPTPAPAPAPTPAPAPAPRTRGAGGASPIPTPSPAPNHGSGGSDPDYSVPIPNPGSGWRWEQWESSGTDNGSSATGSTGNRRAQDPTPAPSPNPTPAPSTAQGSSQQRQENTYDRTFNGGQWWNRGQDQSPDSTGTDTQSGQSGNGTTAKSTDYIFPFGGKTIDEAAAESAAERERKNREIEMKMHGQTQQSRSTDYVFPFDGRSLDEVAAESAAERERKNREVEMKMRGRTQLKPFEEMERQSQAAVDDWMRRLNKYRSDIDEQYGEFKREADRMMTDSFLPKRTRLALSNDISRMEQLYKRYVRGKYDTDLDGKKAFSEQIASVLEGKFPSYQAAINNMVYEYGEYQNQILLASFYGVNDIPNMSMREYTEWKDDSDFDKYDPLAVQRLIDDLRAGKKTTYEQEVKDARERSDELRRRRLEENAKWHAAEPEEDAEGGEADGDEITATQQFDDMKSAMDFVKGEKEHTEEDETVAHDIEIGETPDGKINVISPVAPEIPMAGDGSEPGTIADAMRNRYPGNNVTISVNGEPITLDQLKHFRLVVNGEDGKEIAVDNLDELFLATFEIARSDGFDDTDNEPINISPSSSTRAAAPSEATRRNAAFIKDAMKKRPKSYTSSEEWIWVSEHFRAGFHVTGYHRGHPTR